MVARPAQASILAASITDINIAFCRTHDGISHVLRDTVVSVPEKATNELKFGWILPETARNCVFEEQKSGWVWAVCTGAATQRSRAVFFSAHE